MGDLTNVGRSAAAAADVQQYLTFTLGGEMFAIGILNVREIIEYGELTEIPMMPIFIRGVINLRGAVVPVIDLSARFGAKTSEIGRRTCIVIVELRQGDSRQELGIIVDAVSEVLEIPDSDIEPAPSFGANIRAEFVAGMGKVAGKFVIILAIVHVFSVAAQGAGECRGIGGDSSKPLAGEKEQGEDSPMPAQCNDSCP